MTSKTIEIYMTYEHQEAHDVTSIHYLDSILSSIGFRRSDRYKIWFGEHAHVEAVWANDDFYICLYDAMANYGEGKESSWRIEAKIHSLGFSMSYSGWPDDTVKWINYFMDNPKLVYKLSQGDRPILADS